MADQTDLLEPMIARFDGADVPWPGAGWDWAETRRRDGLARFRAVGVPSRKVEAWKYTDARRLAKIDFAPAPSVSGDPSPALSAFVDATADDAHTLVFVNGRLRPDLSRPDDLPKGARLDSLASLLDTGDPILETHFGQLADGQEGRPFLDLATAFMRDGYVLALDPETVVDAPIGILFVTAPGADPASCHTRNLIVAGANSRATVLERHVGLDGTPYFSNGATEIMVADGAQLRHAKLQAEGGEAFHLATILATVGKDALYDNFILSVGGALARNDIYARLDGPGGDCRLNGAYAGRDKQHLDATTLIDHAHPDCRSREVYKGVLTGTARGVFQGKILVRRPAQRTDGYQLNRALLLSNGAEVDSKPELEIYADDVKCSHGATAGEIDSESLFYLRARGIGEAEARSLLVEAFLAEALEEVAVPSVREEFQSVVARWLAQEGKGAS